MKKKLRIAKSRTRIQIWIRFQLFPEFPTILPDRKTGPENRTAIAVSTSPTDANSTVNFSMDEEKGDDFVKEFWQPWQTHLN